MSEKGRVLAIIPARAGSKGLPGKNLLAFNGKPLIQWTIEAALGAPEIDEVVVTSDDDLMLNIAASLNATAHKRAAHLSSDSAQASEVIENILTSFSGFQTMVYLQPTSPLRRSSHIIEALRIFESDIRVPVVSVVEVSQPPEWMYTVNLDGRMIPYIPSEELRRQDTKRKFIPNGAIYVSGIDTLRAEGYVFSRSNPRPYEMNSQESIDIDDQFDFDLAEWILQKTIQ